MGWLKWFGQGREGDSDDLSPNDRDRIAELSSSLSNGGRLSELEQGLAALKGERLSKKEQVSWNVLWIATAFRRGDRSEAFDRALTAMNSLPDEPEIAFAAGQEYEFRGNVEKMIECFRKAPFPMVSAAHALAAARYCYLRGRFASALDLLGPVLDAHFSLKIADDTFLYVRGMPFATTTIATGACLNLLNQNPAGARLLLQRAERALIDGGVTDLEPFVEACERAAPAIAIAALETKRAPHLSAGPLGGFGGIQMAAWQSRQLGSLNDVRTHLDRVAIREDDHQWLKDVRTLALAEAAHRFGEEEEEARCIQAFLEEQPLLLEPEWLLQFGFVQYSERVRSVFWPSATGRNAR
ncbi:MAG: hypothetical protein U0638_08535 [Phycisphaerales bacterium]